MELQVTSNKSHNDRNNQLLMRGEVTSQSVRQIFVPGVHPHLSITLHTGHTVWVVESLRFQNISFFQNLVGNVSWSTGAILGLFVLNWIHLSWNIVMIYKYWPVVYNLHLHREHSAKLVGRIDKIFVKYYQQFQEKIEFQE